MSSLKTNFNDTNGKGTIMLYQNPFKDDGQYYGKFRRKTVDIETLIARIQKRQVGTNELALQQTAGFIKEEILEALTRGESVNVLDLGFLYIAPKGGFQGKLPAGEDGKASLTVKFTPSQTVQNKVESVEVQDVLVAEVAPRIMTVTDQFTRFSGSTVTKGKTVSIEGERLKIDDDEGGVFFCPVEGENKTIVADETQWLKSPQITKNTMKNVIFYAPDELKTDTEYRILVRTFYINGRKTRKSVKETISDVISVMG